MLGDQGPKPGPDRSESANQPGAPFGSNWNGLTETKCLPVRRLFYAEIHLLLNDAGLQSSREHRAAASHCPLVLAL